MDSIDNEQERIRLEREHYRQCGIAWSSRAVKHGIVIDRLGSALEEIDKLACQHKRGAIGKAQKIAREALKSADVD